MASNTVSATRGSWQSAETEPLPGLKFTAARAADVSG